MFCNVISISARGGVGVAVEKMNQVPGFKKQVESSRVEWSRVPWYHAVEKCRYFMLVFSYER